MSGIIDVSEQMRRLTNILTQSVDDERELTVQQVERRQKPGLSKAQADWVVQTIRKLDEGWSVIHQRTEDQGKMLSKMEGQLQALLDPDIGWSKRIEKSVLDLIGSIQLLKEDVQNLDKAVHNGLTTSIKNIEERMMSHEGDADRRYYDMKTRLDGCIDRVDDLELEEAQEVGEEKYKQRQNAHKKDRRKTVMQIIGFLISAIIGAATVWATNGGW